MGGTPGRAELAKPVSKQFFNMTKEYENGD